MREITKERFWKVARRDNALAVILFWWELDDEILKDITLHGWSKIVKIVSTMPGYEKVKASIEDRIVSINNHQPLVFWLEVLNYFERASKIWLFACKKIKTVHTSKEERFTILWNNDLPSEVHDVVFNYLLSEAETFADWDILFCHIREKDPLIAISIFEILVAEATTSDDWYEILNISRFYDLPYPKKLEQQFFTFAIDQALSLAKTFEEFSRLFDFFITSSRRVRVVTEKMRSLNNVPTSDWFRLMDRSNWPFSGRELEFFYSLVVKKFDESNDDFWALAHLVRSIEVSQISIIRNLVKKMLKNPYCLTQLPTMFAILERPEFEDLKRTYILQWHEQNFTFDECLKLFVQDPYAEFADMILTRLYSLGMKQELTFIQLTTLVKFEKDVSRVENLLRVSLPRFSFRYCFELYSAVGPKIRELIAKELVKKANTFSELHDLLTHRFGVPDDLSEEILGKMAVCVSSDRLD